MKDPIRIGVIGGSGVYQMEALTDIEEVVLDTPVGAPSDAYIVGKVGGQRGALLARHGRGHRINPSRVNYRATVSYTHLGVYKRQAVENVIGRLRTHLAPG